MSIRKSNSKSKITSKSKHKSKSKRSTTQSISKPKKIYTGKDPMLVKLDKFARLPRNEQIGMVLELKDKPDSTNKTVLLKFLTLEKKQQREILESYN